MVMRWRARCRAVVGGTRGRVVFVKVSVQWLPGFMIAEGSRAPPNLKIIMPLPAQTGASGHVSLDCKIVLTRLGQDRRL